MVTWWERRLSGRSKAWLSNVSISFASVIKWINNGGKVTKEKSLAIKNRSRTLMRFWIPNCSLQLDLRPLRSRNQDVLYHRTKHFEYIETLFQICAFSDFCFSAFRLFRLSAFSGSLLFLAFCLLRIYVFLGHCFSCIASKLSAVIPSLDCDFCHVFL